MDTESMEKLYGPPSFRLPVEAGKRGVIVIGTDHRVAFTDSNIFHLLGIDPNSLVGRDIEIARREIAEKFKSPDSYESSCAWLEDNLEEVLDDVLELAGSDHRVIHRYSAPLYDEDRSCTGRIEIYSDITKRRELESAVRRAYEELKAAQDQLVQSEKLRAVGEIASGVAHDFNNMLGIILGNIQLLLRSTNDETARKKLESAQRAALDGVDTVRRIQEFTRARPDEPTVVLSLSELIGEVVEMMRPVWEPHSSVWADCTNDAFVQGVPHELREVITNIILNAVQASPDEGHIDVSIGQSASSCWIRIADNGTGMTEDTKKRIFDPFFTTRGVAGTGLGMSVAYGIVKRHGGSIAVESELGRGTVVTVFLPSCPTPANTPSTTPQPDATITTQRARILVVDDEGMFVSVFVEMLTECGHAATIARSGPEAIEKFSETPFDLVFTDLGMPGMSGWQVAESIKNIEPNTPIVLLTGWGAAIDKPELTASKVDMVLAKPVDFTKLSSIVEEALSRTNEQ